VMLRAQLRKQNVYELYAKYTPTYITERSIEYGKRFENPLSDRNFIQSVTRLGLDMEKEELSHSSIRNDSSRIFVLRTENDPLAQDNGMLKKYYPNATEHVFAETGHLTPYIQTHRMMQLIDEFLEKK